MSKRSNWMVAVVLLLAGVVLSMSMYVKEQQAEEAVPWQERLHYRTGAQALGGEVLMELEWLNGPKGLGMEVCVTTEGEHIKTFLVERNKGVRLVGYRWNATNGATANEKALGWRGYARELAQEQGVIINKLVFRGELR